jgi:hypothetical protein
VLLTGRLVLGRNTGRPVFGGKSDPGDYFSGWTFHGPKMTRGRGSGKQNVRNSGRFSAGKSTEPVWQPEGPALVQDCY